MRFEGIAKTNTTNTLKGGLVINKLFEGIAKTNTTNTTGDITNVLSTFEGIAKTNTTNTIMTNFTREASLRVLLKQIQQTPSMLYDLWFNCLRVLLKQIQQTHDLSALWTEMV